MDNTIYLPNMYAGEYKKWIEGHIWTLTGKKVVNDILQGSQNKNTVLTFFCPLFFGISLTSIDCINLLIFRVYRVFYI